MSLERSFIMSYLTPQEARAKYLIEHPHFTIAPRFPEGTKEYEEYREALRALLTPTDEKT